MCAMHLQAAGGGGGGSGDASSSSSSSSAVVVPVPDSARFWRRLYRHALNADTFHWHAESSRRAWASVHAHDEARRHAAFTAAASAGVVGPYVGVVDGKEFHHENIRLGISEWRYAPEAGRCTSWWTRTRLTHINGFERLCLTHINMALKGPARFQRVKTRYTHTQKFKIWFRSHTNVSTFKHVSTCDADAALR